MGFYRFFAGKKFQSEGEYAGIFRKSDIIILFIGDNIIDTNVYCAETAKLADEMKKNTNQ